MDSYTSMTEKDGGKAYETIFDPKRYRREEGDLLSSWVADVSGHLDRIDECSGTTRLAGGDLAAACSRAIPSIRWETLDAEVGRSDD